MRDAYAASLRTLLSPALLRPLGASPGAAFRAVTPEQRDTLRRSPVKELLRGIGQGAVDNVVRELQLGPNDADAVRAGALLRSALRDDSATKHIKGKLELLFGRVLADGPAWLTASERPHLLRARDDAKLDAQQPEAATSLRFSAVVWNVMCTRPVHNIALGMPAKAASLAAVVAATGAVLAPLVECPGDGVAGVAHPNFEDLLRAPAALGAHWRFTQAPSGAEAIGFAYDTRALRQLLPAVVFPDAAPAEPVQLGCADSDAQWVRAFSRPPVLAVFAAADTPRAVAAERLGLLAVVAVHLKAKDGQGLERTRAELRRVGTHVMTWADAQLDVLAAAHPDVAARGRTVLLCGDFNLSTSNDPTTPAGRQAYPGDAWAPALAAQFEHLCVAGEGTNFGPPCALQEFCYDAALLRSAGAAAQALRHMQARPHAPLQAEQDDLSDLVAWAAARPRRALQLIDEKVEEAREALRRRIKLQWGDHKPMLVTLDVAARPLARTPPASSSVDELPRGDA